MNKKLNTDFLQDELSGVASFYNASHSSKAKKVVPKTKVTHKVAQNLEQKVEQVSKNLSKSIDKTLRTEDIELFAFKLRKVRKVKVNTEVPEAWKDKLDTMAHQLKVGKYDLVMYIIGDFLGEVENDKAK